MYILYFNIYKQYSTNFKNLKRTYMIIIYTGITTAAVRKR